MTDKNPSNFGDMMIKYFCANCERLKLAEARFRAAEEVKISCLQCSRIDSCKYCTSYINWKLAIAAYEAAVKGEVE